MADSPSDEWYNPTDMRCRDLATDQTLAASPGFLPVLPDRGGRARAWHGLPRQTPRHALLFILATILLDAIGVGLIFPMMPDLMARVGADDTASGAVSAGC